MLDDLIIEVLKSDAVSSFEVNVDSLKLSLYSSGLYKFNRSVCERSFVSLTASSTKMKPVPQVTAKTMKVLKPRALNSWVVNKLKMRVKVQLMKVPIAIPFSLRTSDM